MRVDLEKLRTNVDSTAEMLRRDDTAGHVRPRVTTRLVENVNARSEFIQYDRDFAFECDESEGRAGSGTAPSPLRYFLSGLAFCQQVWYAKGAALVGCEIEDLTIDVLTYMDMRGEHLIDGIPPNPQWIVIEADVVTSGTRDQVLEMVDEANARCPVYSLVSKAVPIYERISRSGELLRDTVPDGLDA